MGTTKYPVEDEIKTFFSKNNGFYNAEINADVTVYYFKIPAQHTDDALDRFSEMFKNPLMSKDAILRERYAIDAEFAAHKFNDRYRHERFLLSLGRPNHPSNSFDIGNLITLKHNVNDDYLFKNANEFHRKHYSANRMHLVIQASMNLDEMESIVTKHFSNIPKNDYKMKSYSDQTHNYAFSARFFNKVFFVKAVKNVTKISMAWCLPPVLKVIIKKILSC